MEKILDFTQPYNVALFDQVVAAAFGGSPQEVRNLSTYLTLENNNSHTHTMTLSLSHHHHYHHHRHHIHIHMYRFKQVKKFWLHSNKIQTHGTFPKQFWSRAGIHRQSTLPFKYWRMSFCTSGKFYQQKIVKE